MKKPYMTRKRHNKTMIKVLLVAIIVVAYVFLQGYKVGYEFAVRAAENPTTSTSVSVEVPATTSTDDIELPVPKAVEEKETITFKVSAYSEFDSCHYPNCAMASTKRAYVGAVACPRKYPLGTKVIIDGTEYTCEDRLAKRYDHRIDIFMGYGQEAYDKALEWGLQTKEVYVQTNK